MQVIAADGSDGCLLCLQVSKVGLSLHPEACSGGLVVRSLVESSVGVAER